MGVVEAMGGLHWFSFYVAISLACQITMTAIWIFFLIIFFIKKDNTP